MSNLRIALVFADAIIQPDQRPALIAINTATFLAVLCWVFLATFLVTRFTATWREWFADIFGSKVYFLAWLVPTVAMFFSLYFSEYLGWSPCKLCWIQRGFIYSLAVLMLFNYFRPNTIIRYFGYALAGICPFVSAYHVNVEIRGEETSFCSAAVSCATIWFKTLGFLTIPGMALTASVTVFVLLLMIGRYEKQSKSDQTNGHSIDS